MPFITEIPLLFGILERSNQCVYYPGKAFKDILCGFPGLQVLFLGISRKHLNVKLPAVGNAAPETEEAKMHARPGLVVRTPGW